MLGYSWPTILGFFEFLSKWLIVTWHPPTLSVKTVSQQTRDIEPMLGWCWPNVGDDGPTSNQHWFNALCFLGCPYTDELRQWLIRFASKAPVSSVCHHGIGYTLLNKCQTPAVLVQCWLQYCPLNMLKITCIYSLFKGQYFTVMRFVFLKCLLEE